MLLKAYLREQNLSVTQFARLVNATPAVVYNWLNGTIPARRFMTEIHRVTRGKVDANEFYRLTKPAKTAAE